MVLLINNDQTENVEQAFTVNDAGQVIPIVRYEDGDELIHTDEHPHCDDQTCPCNANVVPSTLTRLVCEKRRYVSSNNDCVWCGTGESICETHLQKLCAESAALAATGKYLAKGHEHAQAGILQLQESEVEQHAAKP